MAVGLGRTQTSEYIPSLNLISELLYIKDMRFLARIELSNTSCMMHILMQFILCVNVSSTYLQIISNYEKNTLIKICTI